nr:glycosyltransferase family 39 protein [uncultured Zobellia sp.]
MRKNYIWLILLLIIYFIAITLLSKPLKGDELRYISYAENLAQGFYTDSENPDLSNGPGYPIVLLPFVIFNTNFLVPRILNGIFVLIGVFYFYKSVRLYLKPKPALVSALFIALYPPLLQLMPTLYSESLSFFLINGFIFHFLVLYKKQGNWKDCFLASFFLGFLVLTKVIFFHVIAASIFLLGMLFMFKKRKEAKWGLFTLIGAVLFTLPFLLYAYSVTDKPFYLGTRGGELLYHRSTPFENEYGNWFSPDRILGVESDKDSKEYQRLAELRLNHGDFYRRIQPLSNIEKDSVLKTKALENMKNYPIKYLKNTLASAGRLFFNIPNSYKTQGFGTFGYIIPNGLILVFFVLIARVSFLERKKIPFEIKAILIFALIYGFGIVLLLGKPRYFIMMVPSLVLFLVYCYTSFIRITFIRGGNQIEKQI